MYLKMLRRFGKWTGMQLLALLTLLVTVAICVAGCQAGPSENTGGVIPIYASKSDAQAVAAGQFGAIPIAMPGADELELLGASYCSATVVEVRSRAGLQGWTPAESLPRRLQSSSSCVAATKD